MIRFYATALSSYSAKVRIALVAKGVAFEELPPPGGYRSAEWLARVPHGTIPAIEVDGALLAESEAILEYLEEQYPQPALLSGTAWQRAHVRRLARVHDLHLEPRVRALFPLFKDAARSTAAVEAAAAALAGQLQRLDAIARPAPYMAGATLSLADCGFAVSIPLGQWLLQALQAPVALPARLQAWLQTVQADPAVARALAPWQAATRQWMAEQATTTLTPTPQKVAP